MAKLTLEDIKATIEVIFKQRVANLIAVGTKGRVLFCRKNLNVAKLYSHESDATYYTKTPLAVDVVVYSDKACETEVGTITAYNENVSFLIGETVHELTTENVIVEHGHKLRVFGSAVFSLDDDEKLEKQIKQVFDGGAVEVNVLEYSKDLASMVEEIKLINWNWIFTTDVDEQQTVASYCKENKKFGLVYNLQSDSMYVVSNDNPSATLSENGDVLNTVEILPVLVGVIAGCPYDKSISYKVFTIFKSVTMPSEIRHGQCTLYNEEEGVRVASPVNTLVTLGENITEDMKSICIVEGMVRLREDVVYAFRTGYKGKYKNKYDNQCLFFSAVNYYLVQLEELGILDPEYDNHVDVNVKKQRQMWIAVGKDADEINKMSDLDIKKLTFKDMVFPLVDCKFLNAIEGMSMEVEMY